MSYGDSRNCAHHRLTRSHFSLQTGFLGPVFYRGFFMQFSWMDPSPMSCQLEILYAHDRPSKSEPVLKSQQQIDVALDWARTHLRLSLRDERTRITATAKGRRAVVLSIESSLSSEVIAAALAPYCAKESLSMNRLA